MSTFSGLSTALSALFTQRRGLDLTGQNIANANTEGYSRQRASLEAVGAPAETAFFSRYDGVAGGVKVADLQRLRDAFLETRGHTEHGRLSLLTERTAALAQVEDLLVEPTDSGLQSQLSDFWNAWGDLANRPGDLAALSQLMQRARTLVDSLHSANDVMKRQWTSGSTTLQAVVSEINTTGEVIAELNLAIRRSTQTGEPANELKDRRDLLIMKLAEMTGATTRSGEDGMLDVAIAGRALVRGGSSQALQVTGPASLTSPATPVAVTWVADGQPAPLERGQAAGLLDTLNGVLPTYRGKLDSFTAQLVTAVNAQHRQGYGLDGGTSRDFFGPAGTTAESVQLALTDADHLAASSVAGAGNLDEKNAHKLAALARDPNGPDAFYRSIVVDLAVEGQTARRLTDIQRDLTAQIDSARDAEAGVELDEEMVNMLAFQRAYEGAARMMTAVDETLDRLINRTGIVGR